MIETGTVDGKKATLSYVDDMLVPVDDKADATMIVAWVEGGQVLYLRVSGKPVKDAWREDLHPRGQPENKGQFGPGGGGAGKSKAQRLIKRARAVGRSPREQHEHEIAKGMRPATPRAAAKAEHAAVTQAEATKLEKGKAKSKDDFAKAKINLRTIGHSDEQFLKTWNEQVGMSPEEFKAEFVGGVPSSMEISFYGDWMKVEGMLAQREGGPVVGRYDRDIYLKDKKAYSAFFKIEKAYTDSDIGKKVLAGNVAVYEKLGITSVGVTANIDVGGYAWAKYGYVPTQAAWDGLRRNLASEMGSTGRGAVQVRRAENMMEADDWNMLGEDQQNEVRDAWMRDTHQQFLDNEIDSWRDSGQALEDAKRILNYEYDKATQIPSWADDELDALRDAREEEGQPEIPFTNQQLFDALKMSEYESRSGNGGDDPEFEWDDDKLQEPKDLPPKEQLVLPGVKPPDYSKRLDEDMRDEITNRMIHAFNSKADSDAADMDAPDYLGESVTEYQEQFWDEKTDADKLEVAQRFEMNMIEIPVDEEEKAKQKEMQMEKTAPVEEVKPVEEKPKGRTLLEIANDPRPKAIWEFADAPGGKALLLQVTKHRSWNGMLNLKDKESYERFKKYVGRVKDKKRAA